VIVGASGLHEPEPPAVVEASRVYRALHDLIDDEALDALTLRCFDLIERLHTSGCVALAQCNDDRVIAGCEGDVVSTVAMLWVERLLDEVPWMANPADVDPGSGRLTLAHCTIARSIVESYRLRTHFESGEGVGIEGRYPLGPVTLVRLGGRGLDQLWTAEGEVVDRGADEDRCRTQIDVGVAPGVVDGLLQAPLGNHVVVVRGHHARRLRSWWDLFVAPVAAARP
jgi:L-fucose isomerase-like protein